MVESELAGFLRDRLDELETAAVAAAKHAGGAHWGVDPSGDVVLEPLPQPVMSDTGEPMSVAPVVGEFDGAGWHVALHSPARVLAEIESKRELVDQCLTWQNDAVHDVRLKYLGSVAEIVLSVMALPWSDHQDYQSIWQPL